MKFINVFVFIIILSILGFAQPVKVNIENNPSTFLQENPKIWRLNQNQVLVTWEDYRHGTKSIYGQVLNFQDQKHGKNFPLYGHDKIFGLKDSIFLAIRIFHTYYENEIWSYGITNFNGRLYRNEKPLTEPLNYFTYSTGPCGTGFIGIAMKSISLQDQFLFVTLFSHLDEVSFSANYYDYDGHKIRTFTHYSDNDFPGILMTAESLNDKLALIWLEKNFNYGDSLSMQKLIFETFDQQDVRLDSIVLDELGQIENPYQFYLDSKLTSNKIKDSTVVVAFWDAMQGTLNLYTLFSKEPKVIKQQKRISWEEPYELQNLYIQPGRTQGAIVNLYFRRFADPLKYVNYFYYLDENGNFNGDSLVIIRTDQLIQNARFLYVKPDSFLVVEENQGDIFMKTTHNFGGEAKIKLNDDLIGSNELAGSVIIKNEKSFLATYEDELGYWGRNIDLEGNLSVNEISLPSINGEFFKYGTFLSFWKRGKKAGFSTFDADFNLLTTKTILEVGNDPWDLQTAGKIVNDSTFLQVAAHRGRIHLFLFDRNGQQKKASEFPFENYLDTLSLRFTNDGSFWCIGEYELQKFSNLLKPLTARIRFSERIETVFGDKILTFPWTAKNTGSLFTISQDTLTKKIELAPTESTRSAVIPLPDNQFFVSYASGDQLRFRLFDKNGNQIRDGLILADSVVVHKAKRIKITVFNDKVYLTWSAIPGQNSGYDVYTLRIPLKLITGMEEQKIKPVESFMLSNYPNPFNAQTTIQFFVPHNAKVSLCIYDLLGRKVRQLLSSKQMSGKFKVIWDGINDNRLPVASGIYWCKLQAEEQSVWRKLVLVK